MYYVLVSARRTKSHLPHIHCIPIFKNIQKPLFSMVGYEIFVDSLYFYHCLHCVCKSI